MEPFLRIHLLGFPRISVEGRPIKDFPTEKAKLLFFYLLLFRDARHSRAILCELFWGNSTDVRSRHSLSTTLWRLRRWLEETHENQTSFFLIHDDHIGLNAAVPIWLDVWEFEERITRAKRLGDVKPEQAAAWLNEAVELYQGELLEGYYADWCLAERDRLHQLLLRTLVQLMVHYREQKAYSQAIAVGQRIVAQDPLREEVQRELIRLYAANHEAAEALRQYRRCEAALRDELGIEPMPETRELFRQLMLSSQASSDSRSLLELTSSKSVPLQFKALLQRMSCALDQFDLARDEMHATLESLRSLSEQPPPHR